MPGRSRLFRHWKSKLFSIFLAALTWFALVGHDVQTTGVIEARISVKSLDGVSILPHQETVKVRLRGASGKLKALEDRLKEIPLIARISFTGEITRDRIPEGQTLNPPRPFAIGDFNLAEGIHLAEADPPELIVRCQREKEVTLKVEPKFFYRDGDEEKEVKPGDPTVGIVGEGYEVDWNTTRVQPASVKVRGPETVVSRLKTIQTEPVDIGGLKGLFYGNSKLIHTVSDRSLGDLRLKTAEVVTVIVSANPEPRKRTLKAVPISFIRPRVFPYTIASVKDEQNKNDIEAVDLAISGPPRVVDSLTSKDVSIQAAVDLRMLLDLKPGVERVVPLKIMLPAGVKLDGTAPSVEVVLSAIQPAKPSPPDPAPPK